MSAAPAAMAGRPFASAARRVARRKGGRPWTF